MGYDVFLLRNLSTVRNSKIARYLRVPLASLLCRRAATLSAAVQSALVHCAAEQVPCQLQYNVP